MQRYGCLAILGSALIALSACNSTDALTPKADIPNAPAASEQTVPVASSSDAPPARQASAQPQAGLPPIDGGDDPSPPQNTLEAQAQALQGGQANPAAAEPVAATPAAPRANNGTLGANLYRTDGAAPATPSIYSNQPVKGAIRFMPIIGAPIAAVTPLSRELGTSARGNGLTIKGSNDQNAEHVLKGYLSAFSDGQRVTVIYVWDVLDNAGARLHRIQGQEIVPAKGADAWSAVPPEVMQSIGSATIASYMKWRESQG
ncbi:hypothetical protein [Rhizobium sp. G21]|uniref:hypothetical protein n=1 Tax=Rhizobium sp. G21 TaxID=2758439 RepID=UPI0016038994|nr:hypothetical protein [Rhizobium sp. G21]MBB1250461.1 hypothetical protein [Rhizobium sp. G21]